MSRVFRRPMFRKGGEVGGGIMTGIRSNFQEGTPSPSERIQEALKKFEEPTADYFKARQAKKDVDREVALAGVEADIGADLERQKIDAQAKLAKDEMAFKAAEGDKDRQNKIAVEIQEGKNKIAELQFKLDNPEADPAKRGVIPSPETRVLDLTKIFSESENLAVEANPNLTASNIVRFQVNASPEIQSKFKGFVKYAYGTSGTIQRAEPTGQPGDIFYDPQTADFLILDNQGNTYRLDPLTYEAEER